MSDFYPGQKVYVLPTFSGRFGETRIRDDINPVTGEKFVPQATIKWPNGKEAEMVNTFLGPFPAQFVPAI